MKRIAWLLGLLLILTLCLGIVRTARAAPVNLLTNGDFAAGVSQGWEPFWARQIGSGTMALDSATPHSGHPSLRVTHTGADDWSAAQAARIPVQPGGIYRLSGWARCEKTVVEPRSYSAAPRSAASVADESAMDAGEDMVVCMKSDMVSAFCDRQFKNPN